MTRPLLLLMLLGALLNCGVLWAAAVPPDDDKVIFRDTFETIFSPGWGEHSATIRVVPEDPKNPKGNHVARFTKERAWLSAPIKPQDLKATKAQEETLKKVWRDYEFSFRWRVGPWDQAVMEQSKANTFGIFAAGYRACPVEDNLSLRYWTYFGVWKQNLKWRLQTPYVVWNGNVSFDQKNIETVTMPEWPTDKSRILDHGWHTFRVTVVGERVTVYWDGELYFIGTDDRAPYGGISIESWCSLPVEYWDVDDVLVKKIDATAPAANKPTACDTKGGNQ